jgi:cell division protease FtsH
MVVYFGLNKQVGNVSYYDSTGQQEYAFTKPYSEATAEVIDQEIKKIIDEAYERAKMILSENKDKLEKLAEILLKKEVIFREDLEHIFGKRAFDDSHLAIPERTDSQESASIIPSNEKENLSLTEKQVPASESSMPKNDEE